MIFSLRILILIAATYNELSGGVNGNNGSKCKYACGNYVKLVEDNETSIAIEKINVKGTYTFIDPTINIYVLSRENMACHRAQLWTKGTVNRP